ncbi:MAG: hypothetical protein JSS64_03995 [Bacteroidetes bacterium]|nr:hypothetical protein [Bacteroidota bacterium]
MNDEHIQSPQPRDDSRYIYEENEADKMWSPGVDVVNHPKSVDKCLPMMPPDKLKKIKCMLVVAKMGLGKTEELEKWLAQYGELFPRILLVSTRRAFASTLLGFFRKFGFSHYRFGAKELSDDRDDIEKLIDSLNHVNESASIETMASEINEQALAYIDDCECTLDQIQNDSSNHEMNDFFSREIERCELILQACEGIAEKLTKGEHDFKECIDKLSQSKTKQLVEDLRWLQSADEKVDLTVPRLIIQYESLHKLVGVVQPYDLVIVDEIRSVVSNMCCKVTNKRNRLAANSTTFAGLLKSAKLSIHMDAHAEFDDAVPQLLQHVYEAHELRVDRYEHVKLMRKLRATKNKVSFNTTLSEHVEQAVTHSSPPVAICCRTRSAAETYHKMLINQFPDVRIEMFTGHSSKYQLRQFENIADFMTKRKPHVVIMSSVVTVGASIKSDFSKVFVDFFGRDGFCCPAREMLQLIGRFRSVKDTTVLVFQPNPVLYYANLKNDIIRIYDDRIHASRRWKEIIESQTERKLPSHVNCDLGFEIGDDGIFRLTPKLSWFTKIVVSDSTTQQQNQAFLLYSGAVMSGWEVLVDGQAETDDIEVQELNKKVKVAKKAARTDSKAPIERLFHEIQSIRDVKEIEKISLNAKNSDERDIKQISCIARTASFFVGKQGESPDDWALTKMPFNDFKYAMEHNESLWNLARFKSDVYTLKDVCLLELKNTHNYFPITNKNYLVRQEKALEALEILKINPNPFSGVQEIKICEFESKRKKLIELADAMTKLRTARKPADTVAKEGESLASTRLGNELKFVFGTHFKAVRKSNQTTGYKYIAGSKLTKLLAQSNHASRLDETHDINKYHEEYRKWQETDDRGPPPKRPCPGFSFPERTGKPQTIQRETPQKRDSEEYPLF